ncbi:hypothetical protein [Aquimarina agarivorans]|uniref:hypothetical protein n=1 Tax=Aquimarina agarivorans TaxID=980584 RepID=UPI0003141E38|nr:hypothetical protein [Aquimarina agarivorans]
MDIQQEIDSIIEEIKEIRDPNFILAIKNLLIYHKKMQQPEWWKSLKEEEKQELTYGSRD